MKQDYVAGLLLWAFCFVLIKTSVAQRVLSAPDSSKSTTIVTGKDSLLFGSVNELAFTLTAADLRVLLKDRGDKPVTHVASLTYVDSRNQPVSLPLTLKVRGNFRRSRVNCSFPPCSSTFPKRKPKKRSLPIRIS